MSEDHQPRGADRMRWWSGDPNERFWLEATDRDDIGANLKAPEADGSGADNWRYTLFKEVQPEDIVLHYDKRSGGVIGYSTVAGPWTPAPIIWAARGSYAREKGTKPHERAGFVVPLRGHIRFLQPVTIDRIRGEQGPIRALLEKLTSQHREPLYFPFELSPKRPMRLLQGYAFKLPSAFVGLFPEIAEHLSMRAEVTGAARNPPWSRDELIIALEFYLRHPTNIPGKASHEIGALSAFLNRLAPQVGLGTGAPFVTAMAST